MSAIEWDVLSIFEHVLRRTHPHHGPMPRLDIQFRPFAGMNHRARLRDGCLEVRLSDLLHGAEARVIEAVATILMAKLYGRTAPREARLRYKTFVESQGVEQRIAETRRLRGRKRVAGAKGRHYDLAVTFADLNARYFRGLLPRVRLSWSARPTRVRLGHYDAIHQVIVVSCSLDRPEVPHVVVEFILYHEMLHLKHPVERTRGRRVFHGRNFRVEEKRFAGYQEARKLLRGLGSWA